jgi:transmembrane sensor
MTDSESPKPLGNGEQLREEAALWFSRMRRPDADVHRQQFEAWLALGALHRSAYNRIAEVFSMGKNLSMGDGQYGVENDHMAVSPRRHTPMVLALVAVVFFAAGLAIAVLSGTAFPNREPLIAAKDQTAERPAQLATLIGEIRTFRLPDGSSVTLDTDSLLSVSYSESSRRLRLERGRARFDVTHEYRPFVVAAGGGTVTARGTLFDVSLSADNGVFVKLLRGSVDVAMPVDFRKGRVNARKVERLMPGEQLSFAAHPAESLGTANMNEIHWPDASVDFDRARLAEVIAQANRYSTTRIILADPRLAEERVSGTFRINDANKLAARLAAIFELTVDRSDPSLLALRPNDGVDMTK